MSRLSRTSLVLVTLLALSLGVDPVGAERAQKGDLIVSINGGIFPAKLPRDHAIPVAVALRGGVQTASRSPLPRVNRLKLELAWRGVLLTRGLPVCPQARLKGLATNQAVVACGGALVGRGKLDAKVFLPDQRPFNVRAYLLAFNGRTKVGRRAVLLHAYTKSPPISFVIPFVVHRHPGPFHTVLVTTLRRSVGTWPHVASFRADIARAFVYRGKRRSYLTASCPLPPHFTSGFLSFAQATYSFNDDRQIKVEAVRSCRAR